MDFCKRGHLRSPENQTTRRTCKECMKERAKTPEQKVRQYMNSRRMQLRRRYGLTPEQWATMFAAQNGRCMICGKHQSERKRTFNVDHDHKTGKIRALLCAPCNVILGLANDNPGILEKAISYLKEHSHG